LIAAAIRALAGLAGYGHSNEANGLPRNGFRPAWRFDSSVPSAHPLPVTFRIALCQIDTIPGDVPGNVEKIRTAAAEASRGGADLAIFPELAVVGYCPRDLLFRRRFLEAADAATEGLARSSGEMGIVVGTVGRNASGAGRPFTNDAAFLANGRVLGRVQKSLLPTYDVFDEGRYFEPGGPSRPIRFRDRRFGVIVCEDLWAEPVDWEATGYGRNPVESLRAEGVDVLLNISASPFNQGKARSREALVATTAARAGVPMALCNLVGANDDVVFDGRSVAVDRRGATIARGPAFEEGVVIVDLDAAPAASPPPLPGDDEPGELFAALVMGLRGYARKAGFSRAHLGLSGGIDSTLVAILAVEALGADSVSGFALPGPFSSQGSLDDAYELAKRLGIRCETVRIDPAYRAALEAITPAVGKAPFGLMEENLQSRIRGMLLMAVANRTSSLLLSTGNKSELAVGYCTLYGDLCGGLAVISDVYKTDVYRVCRWLGETRGVVPEASMTKPPSAELRPNQTDQDSLPPYETLDAILKGHLEEELGARDLVARGHDAATVRDVLRMVARNEFKRKQAPPGLRVSRKAFGQGRRIPIVGSALDWMDAPGLAQ
jgi:NAD+ synthase (glutamine-hydrolysing)